MALLHMNFHSDVLRMAVSADVILPQASKTQIGMDGTRTDRFPTLYLLHGLSDDHTVWGRRTSIERYAARYGIAVVMPNVHRSWYSDMAHGGKYLTFISEELPRICRSFFNDMSDARELNYIAGLSMGGYGALKIAMADPSRFAGVASFSGAFDIEKRLAAEEQAGGHELLDVFGSRTISDSSHDVFAAVQKQLDANVSLPSVYLSCGTEDGLLSSSRAMHALLEKHGVAHVYHEAPGSHNWDLWDDEIQRALAYFFEA